MSPTDTIRHRLLAIATQAQTAAFAFDGATLDFPPVEVAGFCRQLESVEARLAAIIYRLAAGEQRHAATHQEQHHVRPRLLLTPDTTHP
jgi:hypothetical protein